MYFSPQIPITSLWLLAAALMCIVLLLAIYFFRVQSVVKYRLRADSERPDKPDAQYLPASVVIYTQGDADTLAEMLKVLLTQNYPAAYEVIVVNEGESADVRDTVSLLRATHSNLYLTFTPEGVVNLSRKKLALTLGIKAARYDIVVLTTTAAQINSDLWLKRMMYNFNENSDIDIVLGYAYIDPDEDHKFGKRRRAFDHVAQSVRWLAVAAAGKPFRGVEYNIAYRKNVFFKNKGFARHLNLHYGDDDIFISEISRPGNSALELSDESIVRLRHGNHPRLAAERSLRRMFTENFIRRRPRILMPLTGWLQLLAIALCSVAAYAAYPNLQAAVIALIMIMAIFAIDIIFWRKAMIALKSRPLLFSIPWLSISYPFRRLSQRFHSKFGKQKKYTWE